ncbi:MAG: hypothetical protein ACLUKO_17545 [Enterocloster bolteae]
MNQDYKVVGREIKRIIADDIVTGKAVFTDDLRVTGMVYGKVSEALTPMRVLPGLMWTGQRPVTGSMLWLHTRTYRTTSILQTK